MEDDTALLFAEWLSKGFDELAKREISVDEILANIRETPVRQDNQVAFEFAKFLKSGMDKLREIQNG